MSTATAIALAPGGAANKLRVEDRAAHDWYRFVLSFPPHLVREYLDRFQVSGRDVVLDPFCGTGTTLVECKKQGIASVGIEANPIAQFASQTKVDWNVDADELIEDGSQVAGAARTRFDRQGIGDGNDLPLFRGRNSAKVNLEGFPEEQAKLLLKDCISPLPLHRTVTLQRTMEERGKKRLLGHEKLALAKAVVFGASNLHFGPEVGVKGHKEDAPVVDLWLDALSEMATDLRALRGLPRVSAQVYLGDSRNVAKLLEPNSVSAVITSPPYPNEKDYTRTTRLESVLLGFVRSKEELRALKQTLVRSNTRSVYRKDEDDSVVKNVREIDQLAQTIEKRRVELGKTSGFERLYPRLTKLYFGGMARHLADLRPALRTGARLAYVVGDQASYLRVLIRTGRILAKLAQSLGYEVLGTELFRTRLATATREQLREEVVVLRWPGEKASRNGRK